MEQFNGLVFAISRVSFLSGKIEGALEVYEAVSDFADENTKFYMEENILSMISRTEKEILQNESLKVGDFKRTLEFIQNIRTRFLK